MECSTRVQTLLRNICMHLHPLK